MTPEDKQPDPTPAAPVTPAPEWGDRLNERALTIDELLRLKPPRFA